MLIVFGFSFFVAYAIALTLPLIQGGDESPNCPTGLKWVLAIIMLPLGLAGAWAVMLGILYLVFGVALLVSSRETGEELVAYWWVLVLAMGAGYVVAYFVFRKVVLAIYHKIGGWVPEALEGTADDSAT